MCRFLKGSFFCALALLIGAKTGALMAKYFPDFTAEFASVLIDEEVVYNPVVPFGNFVEVDMPEDAFFPCSFGSKLMHTAQETDDKWKNHVDFGFPTDVVP